MKGTRKRTFEAGEVGAAPRATRADVGQEHLRPVVRSEDEDGVVALAQLVDGIQQAADVGIGLRQHVGEVAVAGLALEFGTGQRRIVRLGQRQIEEEGLAGLALATHEVDAAPGQFAIDQRALLQVVDLDRLRRGALLPFHQVFRPGIGMHRLAVDERVVAPVAFVGRVRNSVPLVKALIGREATFGVAEMPFAVGGSGIAPGRQGFGDGDFPLRQAVQRRVDRHRAVAGAHRVATRHQRRAARRALRLDIEVGQTHALLRQCIDARRGRATGDAAAVDARLAIAQVVHQHQHDIRWARGSPRRRHRAQQGEHAANPRT